MNQNKRGGSYLGQPCAAVQAQACPIGAGQDRALGRSGTAGTAGTDPFFASRAVRRWTGWRTERLGPARGGQGLGGVRDGSNMSVTGRICPGHVKWGPCKPAMQQGLAVPMYVGCCSLGGAAYRRADAEEPRCGAVLRGGGGRASLAAQGLRRLVGPQPVSFLRLIAACVGAQEMHQLRLADTRHLHRALRVAMGLWVQMNRRLGGSAAEHDPP